MGSESRLVTSWALLLLFVQIAASFRCDAPPIILPVGEVNLSTGSSKRGVPLGLGSPTQMFSTKIFTQNANTFLKMTTDGKCGDAVPQCIMNRGGGYDRKASKTWSGVLSENQFSGDTSEAADVWAEENVSLAGETYSNFPFALSHDPVLKYNGLGMGKGSTLLEYLGKNQLIASRSWGLYYGKTGDDPVEGSLILGGFDKAKRSDNAHIANFDGEGKCQLIVKMTSLKMKDGDKEIDLLEGQTQNACIRPDYDLISMPKRYFDVFNKATGGNYKTKSTGLYSDGFEVANDDIFRGSMEVKLGDKTYEIENSQLASKNLYYDASGKLAEKSTSSKVLRVKSQPENENSNLIYLGTPFLSASYLYVNFETDRFAVYPVKHTTEKNIQTDKAKDCNNDAPPKDLKTPKRVSEIGSNKSAEKAVEKEIEGELKGEDSPGSEETKPKSGSKSSSDSSTASPSRSESASSSSSSSSSRNKETGASSGDEDVDEEDYVGQSTTRWKSKSGGSSSEEDSGAASFSSNSNAEQVTEGGSTKKDETAKVNGAVVGGAVAGAIVATAAAIVAFCLFRKKKKQRASDFTELEAGKFGAPTSRGAATDSHYAPKQDKFENGDVKSANAYVTECPAPANAWPRQYANNTRPDAELDSTAHRSPEFSGTVSEMGTTEVYGSTRTNSVHYELEASAAELPAPWNHGQQPKRF